MGVTPDVAQGTASFPRPENGHILNIKSVGNSVITLQDMACDCDLETMLVLLAKSTASRIQELTD